MASMKRPGMSTDEFTHLLGEPDEELVRSKFSNALEWIYDSLGVDLTFDRRGTCAAIGLTSPSDSVFRGVQLLRVPALVVWNLVRRLDSNACVDGENLTSQTLGLSVYAPSILDGQDKEAANSILVFRSDFFDL